MPPKMSALTVYVVTVHFEAAITLLFGVDLNLALLAIETKLLKKTANNNNINKQQQ